MEGTNTRKRSYDKAFLKLGFTEFNGKPKCVICLKVLAEESMKRNKLERHLVKNHPGCVDKPVQFFEHKLQSLASQASVMKAFTSVNKAAVHASYVDSYEIAKQKKAHTIGEKFLMPVMKEVMKAMIGEKESKKLNSLSLSARTVKRRIEDMSIYLLTYLIR